MKNLLWFLTCFITLPISTSASECSVFAEKIETVMRKTFPAGGRTTRDYEMEAYNLTTQLKYIGQYKGCSNNEVSEYKSQLDAYLTRLGNPRPNPHDANTYEVHKFLTESLNSANSKYVVNNTSSVQSPVIVNSEPDDPPVLGVRLSLTGETKPAKKFKKKN